VVHAVISLVHELVYTRVHWHIQGRKMSDTTLDSHMLMVINNSTKAIALDQNPYSHIL